MSDEYYEQSEPLFDETEAAKLDKAENNPAIVNATGAEMLDMLLNSNPSGIAGLGTHQKTMEAVEAACRQYRHGDNTYNDLMVAVTNNRDLREALLTPKERSSLNELLNKLKIKLDDLASTKSPANLMSLAVQTLTNISF